MLLSCLFIIFAQMQKLLASYLFQTKSCSLPGLGTLLVNQSGVTGDFSNKRIEAPKQALSFVETESDQSGLIDYLCATWGAAAADVSATLIRFCEDLKGQIFSGKPVSFLHVGSFSVDGSGKIKFESDELPPAYCQPVIAERVVHPDAEHQILVGDKETTNTVMTEMLSPKTLTKDRWWIWAIILGVAGLLLLVVYFTELKGGAPFGNTIKI